MTKTITSVIDDTLSQIQKHGLKESSVVDYQKSLFQPILKYFIQKGCECYDRELLEEFLSYQDARKKNGEIGRSYFSRFQKAAHLLISTAETGQTDFSIYCYEDKLVQEALRRILEAVFEPHFYDEMMGFRPNRSCHMAIKKLNAMIERHPTNYILDADIRGFFDHIDHEWAVKFIEAKIKDPNVTRLVKRMLKAGIMKDYQYEETEEGSGQGSVSSANHCKHLHALCAVMVVQGKNTANIKRIRRYYCICGRLRVLFPE